MASAPQRPTVAMLFQHPAYFMALGAGSGLSPKAPGTMGTLWGWAVFEAIQFGVGWGPQSDVFWAVMLLTTWCLGCWACTRTAQRLGVADPGSVVWDEVWAIWLILWLMGPVGWQGQVLAFAAFRAFDALKPGPVAWADGLFKLRPGECIGWRQGLGIMLDDVVAALCTLLVLALAVFVRQTLGA